MKTIYFIVAAFLFISCQDDEVELNTVRVNHFKQTAVGVGTYMVMLVQEGDQIGTDQWNYYYDGIEGFTYEWGYIYDLKIVKHKISNPPADGSSIAIVLKEQISKNAVNAETTFDIRLKSVTYGIYQSTVMGDATSGYTLLSNVEVLCTNLCEEMNQLLENEDEVVGTFTHGSKGTIQLLELTAK